MRDSDNKNSARLDSRREVIENDRDRYTGPFDTGTTVHDLGVDGNPILPLHGRNSTANKRAPLRALFASLTTGKGV